MVDHLRKMRLPLSSHVRATSSPSVNADADGWSCAQQAAGRVGESCISQDRGDGLLIVAPPQIPTVRIIERVNRELPDRLRLHNRTYSESARIHLRIGAHVGPVVGDHLGVTGETIIRAARLVEAPVLNETMAEKGTGLGIIVSEFVTTSSRR